MKKVGAVGRALSRTRPMTQHRSRTLSRICAAAIDNWIAATKPSMRIVVSRSSPGAAGASGIPIVVALINAPLEFYVCSRLTRHFDPSEAWSEAPARRRQ
jgi:hypothetical protein